MFSIEWIPEWFIPSIIIIPPLVALIFIVCLKDIEEVAAYLGLAAATVVAILIGIIAVGSPEKMTSDNPVELQNYYVEHEFLSDTFVDKDKLLKTLEEETSLKKINYQENDEIIDSIFKGNPVDFEGFSSDDKYISGKFYFTEDSLEIIVFSESQQERISVEV